MNWISRSSHVFAICAFAATLPVSAETNWPQFRGPASRGIAVGDNLPDQWSATENVAWKTTIPGRGWSSPIVWENRVFLTTVVNTGTSEEPRKGLYFGGNRPTPPESVHQWKVLCLDLLTGRVVWERQVHEGQPQSSIHLKNSFASETPVTDGKQLFCYFGNIGIFCFDLDGDEVWNKKLEPHQSRFGWGTAASPVLHGDRLYVVNDNDDDSYLLALEKQTGREVWRVARDEKSNWSTPFIWHNEGRTEIVTPGTGLVRSYGLDGNLLWSLAGMSSITIATPYESGGLLYLSSGYVQDPLRPIYAIRPGATGDISLAEDQTSSEWIAWCQKQAGPYNPTTLIDDDRLYVLYDRGLLACYNAQTGAVIYEPQRLPNGRAFTSSPWAYRGKVFCLNEDGVTFVLSAGDKFELLHTNPLADDDMCMATPAIAGDRLLIRTSARLYCVRAGAVPTTTNDTQAASPPSGRTASAVLPAPAQDQSPPAADSVQRREVTIWSDGTRMVGDLYVPKQVDPQTKLPVVIFCNGTGGTRKGPPAQLGPIFASNGFVFLAFDYRGWGDSDSQLMALDKQPQPDENGEFTVRVRALRWQMNYADQTADIRAAISFVSGEPNVDPQRIGLMGTSYGGGLVTWMAGNDPRVKCVVAQVPGMGAARTEAAIRSAYDLHVKQARGETEPVPYATGKLGGQLQRYSQMRANPAKSIGFSAIDAAQKINIPMLIIDAEKDELIDVRQNGQKVAEILKGRGMPVKYHVINDISHYGVYREAFAEVTRIEVEWFKEQLGPTSTPRP